jgi:hypothetical protein
MTGGPEEPRRRAAASLVVHAPELSGALVTPLGQGLDNTVFLVEDLVLRVSEDRGVRSLRACACSALR